MCKMKIPLISLLLIFFISCNKTDGVDELYEEVAATQMEAELITLINNHRTNIGLEKLQISNNAYRYAKEHNIYMIKINAINHDNFIERAENLSSETNATLVAENVANQYSNAQQILNAWLNSPNHKDNIETNYEYTGICILTNTNGEHYVTQILYK
ncbi:CAP domain-containing protein [Cellulophaga lytica]|uniref:SCP-like extracellular n=2 Tax=Cellulophaga TaxID=104264 RepID=F0RFK6_CELLC|nr:CAP domain-containing protein [Cellulophaga lytica]ADY28954.1 SCP-like extracellular [Cellulophaga lytica DSM 7489]AIM60001.1 hypothetical protein IX49_05510 [Cellulophaga lytica]MDO6854410.1 CAP domain-containing protein [Cellulophaga lytica]WQG76871.1 CAP domain-containing protein [Cellulophaga lytica]SNQ42297.1 SCP-like extracellular [Cellulophaga lytica]